MNRRGFEDYLRRVTAAAERYDEQGVLVYIDLDEFKPINDEIGHDAGDAVLGFVARFFTENVRVTDTVARLGGDEFAILMVQTPAKEGEERARALQGALNASPTTAMPCRFPRVWVWRRLFLEATARPSSAAPTLRCIRTRNAASTNRVAPPAPFLSANRQ